MSSDDVIKTIKKAGWRLDRVRGSHHIFVHPSRPGNVVVPHPKKDLPKGTAKRIMKDAGI